MAKVTLSVIKADIGGFPGHRSVHPELLATAEAELAAQKNSGFLNDYRVMACGDDLQLIMTHNHGTNNESIHKLAWDTFKKGTEVAKKLKLYGAGQDLLKDSFSGNVKGAGPGVAELEFEERKSEPVMVFMGDKTSPGAWNFPLFKMFADPFNSPGLVIEQTMLQGFTFEVHDLKENRKIMLKTPHEMYELLAFIGEPGRYLIKHVFRNHDNEIAAATSTDKLSLIAGEYIGKDDPVMIVRSQKGFPAVGEVLEAFSFPHLVPGGMRGSHNMSMMPCSFTDATPTRFDGPPRIICAGFQITDGKLLGPADMFNDISFDITRQKSMELNEAMRRMGPFEPHRLSAEEMEYTQMKEIEKRLRARFEKM